MAVSIFRSAPADAVYLSELEPLKSGDILRAISSLTIICIQVLNRPGLKYYDKNTCVGRLHV